MNTLSWSNIESRFIKKFDQMFSSNSKKAHFDCVPDGFSVVDGARSKWSQLLLLNALVGFLYTNTFNLATRRKFDQQKILKECIKLEIESLKLTNLWNENSFYIVDIDSQSNWIDINSFREFLENKYPFKSKEKYFGIMNMLLEHETLRSFDFSLITFINASINKIIETPIIYKKLLSKQQKIEHNLTYSVQQSQSKKRRSNKSNLSLIKCTTRTKKLKKTLNNLNDFSVASQIDCKDSLHNNNSITEPIQYLSSILKGIQDTKLIQQQSDDQLTNKLITLNSNSSNHKINIVETQKNTKQKVTNTKNRFCNTKTKHDETIYSFNADKVFEDNEVDITDGLKNIIEHEDTDSQPWILLEDASLREEDSFTYSSNSKVIIDEISYHCTISKSPTFSMTVTEDSISSTMKTSSIYKVHFEPFPVNEITASIRFLPF